MKSIVVVCLVMLSLNFAKAQYQLVWSDEFDSDSLDAAKWNVENNIGIWNTGSNQELQHYRHENIGFGSDTDGSKCLIISAKKETYNNYSFTSGKIDTKAKFSVKYGRIEARIKMPNVANGLWPAFWLLGYSEDTWPKNGEIDIVEMGFKDAITRNVQNKLIKSTLHWDNNNSYAGYGDTSIQVSNLNEGFHVYKTEWTPTYIKSYIDDKEYFVMNTNGGTSEEFNTNLFYIILNLAVGGSLPGITNVAGITAPMPTQMMIDYVRVYQKTGEGEINDKPHAMYGNFGVYDETGSNTFGLDPGFDLKIQSNGLTATSQTAFEGTKCAAYTTTDGQAFNLSFNAASARNMSNYKNGSLYFYIKTNIQEELKLSVGNSELAINSSSPYNFARENNWVKVNIPLTAFGDAVKLDSIVDFLSVAGSGITSGSLAIDKVYWSPITASNDNYLGILTENPNIQNKVNIDDKSVHVFIWESSLTSTNDLKIYEGKSDLAFKGVAGKTWFGFGIFSDNPMDLTAYKDGAMHLTLKTSAQNEFWIGIGGANKTEGKITFPANSGLYGFKRDGQWHNLVIPMADFIAKGVNLSACGNIFMLGGAGAPSVIAMDDIYYSTDGKTIDNPAVNPGTRVNQKELNLIQVFPNPSSEYIVINGIQGTYDYSIFDLSGKSLKANSIMASERIDISNLNAGVYFIKIKDGQKVQMLKFLKK